MKKNNLENRVPESQVHEGYFCRHGKYCKKLEQIDKAHCSLDYAKQCGQVKKNYDKYGRGFNEMGIVGV